MDLMGNKQTISNKSSENKKSGPSFASKMKSNKQPLSISTKEAYPKLLLNLTIQDKATI